MTAPKAFGVDASLTPPPLTWKTIEWSRVRQEVRRLQMRIAKATQAGQQRKVQALLLIPANMGA